jgi:hypothetical protein
VTEEPKKHPGGRPTDYRQEYCDLVIAEMAKGYSLGAFAGTVGVARSTIQRWVAEHPEFSVAVGKGQAARLKQWETAAMKGAYSKDGGNATLIIFGLKNAGRAPAGEEDEWAEKTEVKHSGAIGTFDLSNFNDDELKRFDEFLARAGIAAGSGPSGDSGGTGEAGG